MYWRILFLPLVFFPAVTTTTADEACGHFYNVIGKPISTEPESFSTELCHQGFILSYNHTTKVADWVIERLDGNDLIGPADRKRSRFRQDPHLSDSPQAALTDYRGSGFDRGHLAPAADFSWAQSAMDESFYLSNIAPQVGVGFNRGIWKQLEAATRAWAKARHDIIVMTGPVYFDMTPVIGQGRVVVPDGFYKIIYDPKHMEALAFYLPNAKAEAKNISHYQVTVRHLEAITGFDFFPTLPPDLQEKMESIVSPMWQ